MRTAVGHELIDPKVQINFEKGAISPVSSGVGKLLTSNQARLPAEFKHINKRRKRNQLGYP